MTVSHLTRSRDQLWSDLLVALGGSEAFLSRSISERRILLEIMETFSVTVSTKDIDDLDELLEQVVIAAGGSASHLRQNKHEMLAALVTALGGTPPSATSSSTGELLAACVNAADTGGGGGGDWWDATSKIDIDLVNDRAWVFGVGEVAIDTLLGADANTENAWDITAYDPANLTADGYADIANNFGVALIGAARTKVLGSFTWTTRWGKGLADTVIVCVMLAPDGNDAIQPFVANQTDRNVLATSWNGDLNVEIPAIYNFDPEGDSINVFAVTIDSDRFEIAANGSDVATGTITEQDRPTGNPFTSIALRSDGWDAPLQSITIYDALPSTAGLSALSVV